MSTKSMTEAQLKREGFNQIEFRFFGGFAEADPGFELRICGKAVSCGDTPLQALEGLLHRIDKLEAFKASVEKLVRGPYVPLAARTGDYE